MTAKILMSNLPAAAFARYDDSPDEQFYAVTRLVTHIDAGAISAVTQLYREMFPADGMILDLMSSWVSHLPTDVRYGRVVGVGMNAEELSSNPQLDEVIVQNLNREPRLPFADSSFDGVGICVSIQYLTRPIEVLREVGRVLKPCAPLAVTFSNRCFPTKAVTAWQMTNDAGHAHLIREYLRSVGNWGTVESLDCRPHRRRGEDPLYAVVARKDAEAA
ncbi:MAG: methyltransferase domain-containing protein [Acidobacteriota bacterium]|nr:methyltransferase domain-containing protein [Acidobacteriota bacterium]